MPVNRWFRSAGACILAAAMLLTVSCIKSSPDYTVTFTIAEGITGTPAAGTYSYQEFEKVAYSYKPLNANYLSPNVLLNGSSTGASSGDITVYNHCSVVVQPLDIRNDTVNHSDQWEFILYNTAGGVQYTFRLRFVGGSDKAGAFSDTNGRYGTWTITESSKLTMTYNDWSNAVLKGDISSMTGTWTQTGVSDAYSWAATREDD